MRRDLRSTALQFVIGGELVDSVTGETFETLDPRSGDVIHHVADGSKQDVDNAVAAARKAFDQGPWPKMGGAVNAFACRSEMRVTSAYHGG